MGLSLKLKQCFSPILLSCCFLLCHSVQAQNAPANSRAVMLNLELSKAAERGDLTELESILEQVVELPADDVYEVLNGDYRGHQSPIQWAENGTAMLALFKAGARLEYAANSERALQDILQKDFSEEDWMGILPYLLPSTPEAAPIDLDANIFFHNQHQRAFIDESRLALLRALNAIAFKRFYFFLSRMLPTLLTELIHATAILPENERPMPLVRELAHYLLAEGKFNPNEILDFGNGSLATPFSLAIQLNDTELFELMIANGAAPLVVYYDLAEGSDGRSWRNEIQNERGWQQHQSYGHLASDRRKSIVFNSFYFATRSGDLKTIQFIAEWIISRGIDVRSIAPDALQKYIDSFASDRDENDIENFQATLRYLVQGVGYSAAGISLTSLAREFDTNIDPLLFATEEFGISLWNGSSLGLNRPPTLPITAAAGIAPRMKFEQIIKLTLDQATSRINLRHEFPELLEIALHDQTHGYEKIVYLIRHHGYDPFQLRPFRSYTPLSTATGVQYVPSLFEVDFSFKAALFGRIDILSYILSLIEGSNPLDQPELYEQFVISAIAGAATSANSRTFDTVMSFLNSFPNFRVFIDQLDAAELALITTLLASGSTEAGTFIFNQFAHTFEGVASRHMVSQAPSWQLFFRQLHTSTDFDVSQGVLEQAAFFGCRAKVVSLVREVPY